MFRWNNFKSILSMEVGLQRTYNRLISAYYFQCVAILLYTPKLFFKFAYFALHWSPFLSSQSSFFIGEEEVQCNYLECRDKGLYILGTLIPNCLWIIFVIALSFNLIITCLQ